MATKNIKIRFYVGQMGSMGDSGNVSESLSELVNSSSTPPIDFGDFYYQIKSLIRFNNGKSYRGIFAKLRKNDIPHIGNTDGQEREIDINEDEGVLEKNHFLYFKDRELLGLIKQEPTQYVKTPETNQENKNAITVQPGHIPGSSPGNDIAIRANRDRDRKPMDDGLAKEGRESSGSGHIRGSVSVPAFAGTGRDSKSVQPEPSCATGDHGNVGPES